ncbi:MAG: MOSC domain-containing protein [Gammaproteobacteria bacterium]
MIYLKLLTTFPRPGRLVWIGVRKSRGEPIACLDAVLADPESGLIGDRYAALSGTRQVTLIQHEHLAVIKALTGREVEPEMLRRNLVVAGINLLALKKSHLRIGEVLLETTGSCHPCSKMEKVLGPGGFNAMRGHGGLTARIIEGGWMRLGDPVLPTEVVSPG